MGGRDLNDAEETMPPAPRPSTVHRYPRTPTSTTRKSLEVPRQDPQRYGSPFTRSKTCIQAPEPIWWLVFRLQWCARGIEQEDRVRLYGMPALIGDCDCPLLSLLPSQQTAV
jgi:hypothetical protein